MPESDFRDRLKADEKDLIPIDPLDRCLWVMKATAMSVALATRMKEKGEDTKAYLEHNYVINKYLGDLEYDLKNGKIGEDEFSRGCKEVYDKYEINFDILKQNLDDLTKSEANNAHFKENYYKYKYDEDGKRIPSTEFENEAENFDKVLSDRLEKQTEKYYESQKDKEHNKESEKDDTQKEK